MPSSALFTLGTRGSPLALAQANETRRRLSDAHGWYLERIALKVIRTSGDAIQDRPLAEAGGKGLFTKEIDIALLAGEIDAAVHSAKDLPSLMARGVAIAGFLPREDVRDALISSFADTIEGLPEGASLGAASLRRQAQALRLRPDLKPELLRGNVETRLRKAESGAVGATLLAMAGLKRLGLVHRARAALDIEAFLPAPGQGAIALTARAGDARALEALAAIADAGTGAELAAERAYLAELEGSCRTPIAGLARIGRGRLTLKGQVLRTDGSESFAIVAEGASGDAERLGREAGRELAGRLPAGVLAKG
ncbi:MAG: hydroxymethylbilane synthase [Roseiarcus sp.]|uniref:hydroxymethylbilane synthase n=2 Tax=Roseiarcus sp. TaxID=1969460 RepID=UPI003C50EF8B